MATKYICALLGLAAVFGLSACGSSPGIPIPDYRRTVYIDRARIDHLSIWPEEHLLRGSIVEVDVDVHEPGGIRAHAITDYDGPRVRYTVSGGQLNYHDRVPDHTTGGWRNVEISGNSCLGPTDGFTWTLPQEPGFYTLRVEYYGLTRSLRVCVE